MSVEEVESQKAWEARASRLLHALGEDGVETLKQLESSRIFLVGLRGLGIEIAKNLVLMGVSSLTIQDLEPVEMSDLSTNFYLSEADVGKNRAQAVLTQLRELNERVKLDIYDGEVNKAFVEQFSVVIFTNNSSFDTLLKYNTMCRENNVKFITADTLGLFAYTFVDMGKDDHIIKDKDGERPKTSFVSHITKEEEAVVTIVEGARHDLEDGDYVRITEVEGMQEINGKEFKVTVKGPSQLVIGDTSGFSDYTKGGYMVQVKKPVKASFDSLESFVGKKLSMEKLQIGDWSKFNRSTLYFMFLQTLLAFRKENGRLPAPHNKADAEQILAGVKKLNEALPEDERYTDKDFNESPVVDGETKRSFSKVVMDLSKTSAGSLNPMAAAIGGIVAQEVLKATTNKFTPINQFLFTENLECLPTEDVTAEDAKPRNTRYDGQIAVFGNEYNEKILNLNYFVVGAGAIGCEMLKNFAMMGIGCGPKGKVTVTDMDTIEISNLNRQFLYRSWDVTKLKSKTACAAVKKMNPNLNIEALATKVAPSTENVFNDEFWESLDGVANAVDNVQARLYIDRRCVFFRKPLVDSGTLGSKGNVQVIVPHLTESYGSSTDPPAKETPICLLHSFPNNIEHCLQWAREDCFEGHFVKNPDITNSYLEQPGYLSTVSPNLKLPTLKIIKDCLIDRQKDFKECIAWARLEFQQRFNWNHKQLLYNFPLDYIDSHGAPFWSGSKRPPKAIDYDPNDPLHAQFVVSATFLRAYTLNIIPSEFKPSDFESQAASIAKEAASVPVPEWKPKVGIKIETDESVTEKVAEVADDDDVQIALIEKELPDPTTTTYRTHPVDFEKDDDRNFHIDFIHAASNLRAIAYGIKPVTQLQSKLIAGRIMPAMITTTALVTGLVCLELYKLFHGDKTITQYTNSFVNLALPLFQQSEPIAPEKLKFRDSHYTLWDRIDIKEGDITLQEFLDYLKKNYQMDAQMVGVGTALIYTCFGRKGQQRLPKKLSKLVPEIAKIELPENQRYFNIEVTAEDVKTGEDVDDYPDIFVWFK